MKNIVLVGFMGTGKTAVAKELSKKLARKYVSTDELIEKKEKMAIKDIFAEKGEGYFRKIEKDIIKEVSLLRGAVIDAGGGVVIDKENVENLKKNGIVICLWAKPEKVLERTKKYTNRPLLNTESPLSRIRELMGFRKQFYEKADYHIDTSDMSLGNVIDEAERIVNDAGKEK